MRNKLILARDLSCEQKVCISSAQNILYRQKKKVRLGSDVTRLYRTSLPMASKRFYSCLLMFDLGYFLDWH